MIASQVGRGGSCSRSTKAHFFVPGAGFSQASCRSPPVSSGLARWNWGHGSAAWLPCSSCSRRTDQIGHLTFSIDAESCCPDSSTLQCCFRGSGVHSVLDIPCRADLRMLDPCHLALDWQSFHCHLAGDSAIERGALVVRATGRAGESGCGRPAASTGMNVCVRSRRRTAGSLVPTGFPQVSGKALRPLRVACLHAGKERREAHHSAAKLYGK